VSGAGWQYQPGVSGRPGHLQRVVRAAVTVAHTRRQQAYLDYLTHCASCRDCGDADKKRCATADELWHAYQERQADS
jgi:hypothetical protein